MKNLQEIECMIGSAEDDWDAITVNKNLLPLSGTFVAESKEKLKSSLENICEDIVSLLFSPYCRSFVDDCVAFLKRAILVSDELGASYVFAGYNVSYDLRSTLEIAKRISKNC